MAGRTAEALALRDGDRDELERLTRSSTVPAGLAARARVVLLAADATPNHVIAERVGLSRPSVNKWRARYAERGLDGLVDEPRPGPARRVDQHRIITATLTPPPPSTTGSGAPIRRDLDHAMPTLPRYVQPYPRIPHKRKLNQLTHH